MARPNITYLGGPYSGQEDYRRDLPGKIREADLPGVYVRTRRVQRGHVEYQWVPDKTE